MNPRALLLMAVILPLIGGLITWLLRAKLNKRLGLINLFFTSISLIAIAAAWFGFGQTVHVSLPGILYFGLEFELNALTAFFSILFSTAWFAASIYSLKYMEHEGAQCRFYTFLQLTLAGCLGVVLAADLLTLFLFFEMMTLCSWVLVIHKEDTAAMEAGNLYLYLGIIGGLILLMGIILLYSAAGTVAFTALPEVVANNTGLMVTMGICFLIGFGIKAGIAPLHIWLPKAHPVAPTPASALLSGIMIKTGAYGLFRVFFSILVPSLKPGFAGTLFGWTFLWLGILTMLMGAFLALQQRQAKRTLAYSSVSQIGYIVMGLGAALLPFGKDLYGISGMLFHILNHAVFKTTLFMSVGALYVYTHTLDYDRLGGLLRKYPVLSVSFGIAALGITGLPGLNGYASKTFLHHALTDLYHYNPTWPLWLAEKLFILASALTICYFVKLFSNIFLGEKDWSHLPDKMAPSLQIPLGLGAAAVAAIGLFPHKVVQFAIIPAMETIGFDSHALEYVAHINVWNWHDLSGMAVTIAVAGVIMFLVHRFKIDAVRFPKWLSVERLVYLPLAHGFIKLCLGPGTLVDGKINKIYHGAGGASLKFCGFINKMDITMNRVYKKTSTYSKGLVWFFAKVDQSGNQLFHHAGTFSMKVFWAAGLLDQGLNSIYSRLGQGSVKACIELDTLDHNLDAFYQRMGLIYTRAVQKADILERKMSGPIPKINPKKSLWGQRLVSAMENPAWHLSNLNLESIIVVVALVVVVIVFVLYGL